MGWMNSLYACKSIPWTFMYELSDYVVCSGNNNMSILECVGGLVLDCVLLGRIFVRFLIGISYLGFELVCVWIVECKLASMLFKFLCGFIFEFTLWS